MKKGPEDCVRCGKCLPHCPSYKFFLKESFSPRGRNFLLSKNLESKSFEFCLLCENCKSICPHSLSFPEFYLEKLFSKKNLPLPYLENPLTLLNFFPQGKKVYKKGINFVNFTSNEGDFYLYLSCGLKHLYPEAFLKFNKKIEVFSLKAHIPRELDCCGIAYLSLGSPHTLKKFALNKLKLFSEEKPLLTFCATCLWVFKRVYPKLFENTPEEKSFLELAERTYFVFDYLNKFLHYNIELENKSEILYHNPCHLKGPLTYIEKYLKNKIECKDFCCGSAKANLWFRSFQRNFNKLWKRELLGKRVLATACTGCYLNFSFLLRRPPEIKHWVELMV
ncbi:MAG: (Fe-S)-binding protein [Caldimicrobium sp.]